MPELNFCGFFWERSDRRTDRQTHGPMAETFDLGSRDLKTCFGTEN
jgi:hypothetical protein